LMSVLPFFIAWWSENRTKCVHRMEAVWNPKNSDLHKKINYFFKVGYIILFYHLVLRLGPPSMMKGALNSS
jgi:hypothetical protein